MLKKVRNNTSNNNLDPWNNLLNPINSSYLLNNLEIFDKDPNQNIIFGYKKISLFPKEKLLLFLGTDVSGDLHLGHLSLLLIAKALENIWNGELIVSLNEIESLTSRDMPIKELFANKNSIIKELIALNVKYHSRLDDNLVVLLSTHLLNLIINKDIIDFKYYYSKRLNIRDIQSLCVMLVTPIIISYHNDSKKIMAIYGKDEMSHLCLIYDLYNSPWFKEIIYNVAGINCPTIGFMIVNLIPGLDSKRKMSKTLPENSILIKNISKGHSITIPIQLYLKQVIQLVSSINEEIQLNEMYLKLRQLLD